MNQKKFSRKTALFAIFLCFILLFSSIAVSASAFVLESRISDTLSNKLSSLNSDENVDVIIWQNDIDIEAIENNTYKLCGIEYGEMKDDLGIEKIQEFISTKRNLLSTEYDKLNSILVESLTAKSTKTNILYKSKVSPVIIASLPKSTRTFSAVPITTNPLSHQNLRRYTKS